MTKPRFIALMAAWLALAGTAGYQYRAATQERTALHVQQTRLEQLKQEITALEQARDDALGELSAAEDNLVQIAPLAAPSEGPLDSHRDVTTKAWLARLKRIQEFFSADPGRRIPEMDLLDDDDWIGLARDARFDNDAEMRTVSSAVRSEAKGKFSSRLAQALRAFVKAQNGLLPQDPLALASYFPKPVDVAILERYEMTNSGSASEVFGAGWVIQEKNPVDAQFDTRIRVSTSGTVSQLAPGGWIQKPQETR